MLVGSSHPLISLLSRNPATSQSDVDSSKSQSDSSLKDDLTVEILPDLREWMQQVEDQTSKTSADSHFYSMDRQLSLTGREALQSYISNAEFSFYSESIQLVGIDVYV